jgi:hypothetical protein
MTNQQLELGYGNANQPAPLSHRRGRVARAAWWFSQMRNAVQSAVDWQPAGEGRPEQVWFPGSHREVKV